MGLDMNIFVDNEEVLYWGKEYRLRNWFSKLDNFSYYGVTKLTKKNIEDLLETCKKVKEDNSLLDKLLPFKDQETAEHYAYRNEGFLKYDLDYTIKELEDFLNNVDDNSNIEYWESY